MFNLRNVLVAILMFSATLLVAGPMVTGAMYDNLRIDNIYIDGNKIESKGDLVLLPGESGSIKAGDLTGILKGADGAISAIEGDEGQLLTMKDGEAQWQDAPVSTTLDTKGDIQTHDGTNNEKLPVGADDQILSANSEAPTGLEWIDLPVSTTLDSKGDIQGHDGLENVKIPVGEDGQVLTADSSSPTGLSYKDMSVTLQDAYEGGSSIALDEDNRGIRILNNDNLSFGTPLLSILSEDELTEYFSVDEAGTRVRNLLFVDKKADFKGDVSVAGAFSAKDTISITGDSPKKITSTQYSPTVGDGIDAPAGSLALQAAAPLVKLDDEDPNDWARIYHEGNLSSIDFDRDNLFIDGGFERGSSGQCWESGGICMVMGKTSQATEKDKNSLQIRSPDGDKFVTWKWKLETSDYKGVQMLAGCEVKVPERVDDAKITAFSDGVAAWSVDVPAGSNFKANYFPIVGGDSDFEIHASGTVGSNPGEEMEINNCGLWKAPLLVRESQSTKIPMSEWEDAGKIEVSSTQTAPEPHASNYLDEVKCRRIGDSLELNYRLEAKNGTPGTGDYLFKIPTSCGKYTDLVVDPNKATNNLNSKARTIAGYASMTTLDTSSGVPYYFTGSVHLAPTSGYLLIKGVRTGGSDFADPALSGIVGNKSDDSGNTFDPFAYDGNSLSFNATVPIEGWAATEDGDSATAVTQKSNSPDKAGFVTLSFTDFNGEDIEGHLPADGRCVLKIKYPDYVRNTRKPDGSFIYGECTVTEINDGVLLPNPGLDGLFFRTATAENPVGSAQEDQFQGHHHQQYYGNASGRLDGGTTLYRNWSAMKPEDISISTGDLDTIRHATTDGINGEPRTGDETRPKNMAVAAYVRMWDRDYYIRGTFEQIEEVHAERTVETENEFSGYLSSGTTLSGLSIDGWVSSATRPDVGVYKIATNSFDATPNCWAVRDRGHEAASGVRCDYQRSISSKSELVFTCSLTQSSPELRDADFTFGCQRSTDFNKSIKGAVINASKNPRAASVDQYSEKEIKWGLWNGKQLYRRCFTVTSDITSTADLTSSNSTIKEQWETGLIPAGIKNRAGKWLIYQEYSATTSEYIIITYDSTSGKVVAAVSGGGSWVVTTGTNRCMNYTKEPWW